MITSDDVLAATNTIERVSIELGKARAMEMELEDERPLIKAAATKRLMEAGAATSATAAEKIVEADPEYAAHRVRQREAVVLVEVMRGKFYATRYRCELMIEEYRESTRAAL
jgi:hypothetical protein